MGFQVRTCFSRPIACRKSAVISLLLVSGVSLAEEFEALPTYGAEDVVLPELLTSEDIRSARRFGLNPKPGVESRLVRSN